MKICLSRVIWRSLLTDSGLYQVHSVIITCLSVTLSLGILTSFYKIQKINLNGTFPVKNLSKIKKNCIINKCKTNDILNACFQNFKKFLSAWFFSSLFTVKHQLVDDYFLLKLMIKRTLSLIFKPDALSAYGQNHPSSLWAFGLISWPKAGKRSDMKNTMV